MSLPALESLEAVLENQPHSFRIRNIVTLARLHSNDPQLGHWLNSIADISAYHASIVVDAAVASGVNEVLRKLATHSDRRVRYRALKRLPLCYTDYLALPIAERRQLEKRLRTEHRTDIVAALLELPLSDATKARLLSAADETTAAVYISDLGDLIPSLAAFSQRHPQLVLAELQRRLTDVAPQVRNQAWAWATPAFRSLTLAFPGELLHLLQTLGPTMVVPKGLNPQLGVLLEHDAQAVVELLCQAPWAAGFDESGYQPKLLKCLRRRRSLFRQEHLVALARKYNENDYVLAALFKALPPSQREAVFNEAFTGISLHTRWWSFALLEALPKKCREAEARRMISLDAAQHPLSRLDIAGFLAPEEAQQIATDHLGATNPQERAAALAAIILAAARSREQSTIAEALKLLSGIRNDQDSVRETVFQAVQAIPAALLDLEPLIVSATTLLEARDSSRYSLGAVGAIAWKQVIYSAQTGVIDFQAAELLAKVVHDSWYQIIPSQIPISQAATETLIEILRPQLQAAAKREEFDLLLLLAQRLQQKVWGNPTVDSLIRQALGCPNSTIREEAVKIWLSDPATKSIRIDALLAQDASFVTVHHVQKVICYNRQDLVPLLFQDKPLVGKFWRGDHAWLPLNLKPFYGWLPHHINQYKHALLKAFTLCQLPAYDTYQLAYTVAQLPGTQISDLEPFLQSDADPIKEGALAGLVLIDSPETLPTLIGFADTDQARVAMYALSTAVAWLPPVQAAAALKTVSQECRKVTSKKAALRVLALLRQPDTVSLLSAVCKDPTQHRDIRIAAGRALLDYLDYEEAWQALEIFAKGGRSEALELARTHPHTIACRHRNRLAQLLCRLSPEPEVLRYLSVWSAYINPAFLHEIILYEKTPVAQSAMSTFANAAQISKDWEPFFVTIRALVELSRSATEPNAETTADRPHFHRINFLIERLISHSGAQLTWHRRRLQALAQTLGTDVDTIELSWRIQLSSINWEEPLPELCALADSLPDDSLALLLLSTVTEALNQAHSEHLINNIRIDVPIALNARNTVGASILALAFVLVEGRRCGWTSPWREQLRILRNHPVAAVAFPAQQESTVYN